MAATPQPKAAALTAGLAAALTSLLATPGLVLAKEGEHPPRSNRLVWQLEQPGSPSNPNNPGEGTISSGALVWELDPDPSAAADTQTGERPEPPPGPAPLVGIPLLEPFPAPNLSGALPSAYVANWGDYFVSASAGTPGRQRDGAPDGAINLGFGLGDADRWIALELDWNIGSTRNLNANGDFSVLASRMLVNRPRLQVVLGGGIDGLLAYGNEGKPPVTAYGVVTLATPLRTPNAFFNQVLQISVGYGGQDFAPLNQNFEGPSGSVFAAVGVEITSNVGFSVGWSGRGANANLSYTPFRDLPFTVNVVGADLFDTSPFGRVGVLSVTWGDNFRTGVF